jgi:hypothetical protein
MPDGLKGVRRSAILRGRVPSGIRRSPTKGEGMRTSKSPVAPRRLIPVAAAAALAVAALGASAAAAPPAPPELLSVSCTGAGVATVTWSGRDPAAISYFSPPDASANFGFEARVGGKEKKANSQTVTLPVSTNNLHVSLLDGKNNVLASLLGTACAG